MRAWTIYLWEEGNVVFGATPLVTVDGIREIFYETCEYGSTKRERFQAISQVKKQLLNTMNAINWYGKKVLNKKGEVDHKKFMELEVTVALQASRQLRDITDVAPFIKYPHKLISAREARELKLNIL